MSRSIPKHRFHELVEAATQIFLAEGYRRTQMADVAGRLGIAKGTLYVYFESKEALFDTVLRHADQSVPIEPLEALPVPTPAPGETLQMLEKRVAEEALLPKLTAALARRRVTDVRSELEAIVRELYALLATYRTGIKLLDRCAHDYPELAAVWHRTGRETALGLLTDYLKDRVRRGRVRRFPDVAVAARLLLETVVFWAINRRWDPSAQALDETEVEETVVSFLIHALTEE